MASSSSNRQWIYDVFINFRGKDTRHNFVSHLYAALSNAGINAFLDDEKLKRGSELKPTLLRAIEGSRISLVVLSPNYASSRWCLDELVKIMECNKTHGQIVIPIFYEVDPADVRRQRYAFSFQQTKKDDVVFSFWNTRVPWSQAEADEDFVIGGKKYTVGNVELRWMNALTEVANISGWDTRVFRNQAEAVKNIVGDVLTKLDVTLFSITDFPVGLESLVQEVIEYIESQSSKVCMVGIWGMGGLGKTTTAKAIHNQIHRQFEDRSFIENIREVCEKDSRGHMHLQEQLLSDFLKTQVKIHSTAFGTSMIEKKLSGRRALVVLDDVTTFEQLKALCAHRKWLGVGSVLIVTTRDVRLLNLLKVDRVCRMKEMDQNDSLELFSWHAFREASPRGEFKELSRNVVAYCGGLPLALEVLGSYLHGRTEEEWKSVLSKLERIPNDQVQEKLRISYDGLKDEMEKDIFLDICCFFVGRSRAYVTEILNGCGLYAHIGITVLIEQSLLKVEKNNKLGMHDLVRDMGREIVRASSKKEPGKRSRLWSHKDVHDVLRNNTGTETVEGLVLKLHRTSSICINGNAFEAMKKLRLLQLVSVELDGGYEYLSKELAWVYWRGCPFKYIPNDFHQGNLVVFELKHSNILRVWKEDKLLEKLKILNLSHSRYLKSTPDFSKLPNLEKLIMKDCPSLEVIHQSIGELSNLLLINLKDCTSLRNLPRKIYKLKSLKTLILSGCSNIDKLEEEIGQMESLTTLIANDTAVKEVPYSIIRLKSIHYISLCGYEGLSHDVFSDLIYSWMSPTMNSQFRISPSQGMSFSLVSINIQNNNSGHLSPLIPSLSNLRSVKIQCGSEIQLTQELRRFLDDQYDVNFAKSVTSDASQISNLSMRSLSIGMGSCHLVKDTLGKRIAQVLASSDSYNIFLPGDNYPSWSAYTGEGPSVNFEVPDESDFCMKGITLCVVYSSTPEIMANDSLIGVLIINYTKFTVHILKRDTVMSFTDDDWKGVISNLGPGDNVEIFVAFGHGLTVKKTAVYLIYGTSNAMEIEPSIIMEDELSIKVKIEPSPQVNVLSLPNVEMEPSPEVNVHPSDNEEMEPSPEVNIEPFPEVEMEPSTEVNVEPSTNVEMESSPEVNGQPLPNVETEPSPESNMQPLSVVEMELPEVNVHPSANVEMEPSREVNVQPLPNVEREPSTEVNLQPSTNVEMESSPKPNKKIFTRLAKRMGEILCLSQKRGFKNFGLDMPLS